jgi:flagellar biosynthesis protein FlhG
MVAGSEPPPSPDSLAAPRGVRRVIAVGGGRGGVGKSIVATNLAVYLAQLGRSVVLVDADPVGAELHALLGLDSSVATPSAPPAQPAPDGARDEDDEAALETIPTTVPGLALLPQTYRAGSTIPTRPGRKAHFVEAVRKLDVDYVVMDLGAGTGPQTLDLFLGADLGVTVTTPEPPSVEAVYRFLRALFQRLVRRLLVSDRFRMRIAERAQSELGPLPAPQELTRALARYDTGLGRMAATELARLRPRLIVNGTRLRTDTDLGVTMGEMSKRYLGVALDYLGYVEHDDAVWLSVRKSRALLIDNPTSKSARNLERIARRALALLTLEPGPASAPGDGVVPEQTLYDVLGMHRGATDEELRRAYKRTRENYLSGSLALSSLLGSEALRREQGRIEEANETLLDPAKRRAYDASTFAEEAVVTPQKPSVDHQALEAERRMLQGELAREINAETEFTGRLLAKVREARGVELEEIAKATKISISYLKAIEAEAFSELPAMVYARGFVQELAKYLKLDAAQVTKTYLLRLRQWRAASGGESTP